MHSNHPDHDYDQQLDRHLAAGRTLMVAHGTTQAGIRVRTRLRAGTLEGSYQGKRSNGGYVPT